MNFASGLTVIVWVLFVCATSRAQMVEPREVLSDKTILYVEARDLSETVPKLFRNLHSWFYGPAVKDGRLLPLNIPTFQMIMDGNPVRHQRHWIIDCFGMGVDRQKYFQDVKTLYREMVDARHDEALLSEYQSSMEEKLSELFSGRFFLAIEDDAPHFKVVFGFEYDKEKFDWEASLNHSVLQQTKESSFEVEVNGTKIKHLEDEQIYFFIKDNCVYGVVDSDEDYCKSLLRRISNIPAGDDRFRPLKNSYYLGRVAANLEDENDGIPSPDLFCFANVESLMARRMSGYQLDPREFREFDLRKRENYSGWSNCVGVEVSFDEQNHANYHVCYPLLQPTAEFVVEFADALNNLEPDRSRAIPNGVSWLTYVAPNNLSGFPGYQNKANTPGVELSLPFWKELYTNDSADTRSQRQRFEDEFQIALMNNTIKVENRAVEVCRFLKLVMDQDKSFYDQSVLNFDLLRGVFVQSDAMRLSKREVVDQLEGLFEQERFQDLKAAGEEHQRDAKLRELSRLKVGDTTVSDWGFQKKSFSIARNPSGLFVFSRIGTSARLEEAIAAQEVLSGPIQSFDIDQVLLADCKKMGSLKAICVRRNFMASKLPWSTLSPLFEFIANCEFHNCFSYNFQVRVRGDSNISVFDDAERDVKLSLLTRLAKVPLCLFDSQLNETRNLFYAPLTNSEVFWIESVVINDRRDCINYLGAFTKEGELDKSREAIKVGE